MRQSLGPGLPTWGAAIKQWPFSNPRWKNYEKLIFIRIISHFLAIFLQHPSMIQPTAQPIATRYSVTEDLAGSEDLAGTQRSIDGTRTWPFQGLHRLLSTVPFVDSKLSYFSRVILYIYIHIIVCIYICIYITLMFIDYDHVVASIRTNSSVARPVPGWNSIRIPPSIDSCAPVVITTHWDRKMEPLQTCHFGICSESYFQEETWKYSHIHSPSIHEWSEYIKMLR